MTSNPYSPPQTDTTTKPDLVSVQIRGRKLGLSLYRPILLGIAFSGALFGAGLGATEALLPFVVLGGLFGFLFALIPAFLSLPIVVMIASAVYRGQSRHLFANIVGGTTGLIAGLASWPIMGGFHFDPLVLVTLLLGVSGGLLGAWYGIRAEQLANANHTLAG